MPTTRIGVQAVTGSPGQIVDIDPARITATIANVGGVSVEYSTGGGWTAIAAGASASVSCNTRDLRLRRAVSGAYPVAVDIDWTATSEGEANSLTESQASSVSGGGIRVVPASRDSDGIDAAIAVCVAAGGGTVMYEAARYTITRSHAMVSGVSHRGVPIKWTFGAADDVPDFWTIPATGVPGTVFDVADGVDAFVWNAADQGSVQSPLMAYALTQVHFYGLAFRGGRKAIKIGAINSQGCVDGSMDMVFGYNQACSDGGYAIDIHNSQFFRVGRIRVSNDQAASVGGNFRMVASVPGAVLLPGDCHIEEIYSRVTSRTRKGVVLEAGGATAAILNDIKVIGRVHSSRYASSTPATVNMTSTSGAADISVPNAAEFALCTVGMPVRWQSTAPTTFDAVETCFVVSRSEGSQTVRLSNADYGAAITPTSSGTFATYVAGYPTFMARGDSGCAVKNSNFGDLACEVTGNIGSLMFSKTRNCNANLNNPSTSFTGTTLIFRDAEMAVTYAGANNVGCDESALYAGTAKVSNMAGGDYQYSGGSFTLDSSWNGRRVRYSGTSDITITIPRKLAPGFEFEVVPTGATGVVTFAPAAGLGLWSKAGLRTNGQYAGVRLKKIAALGYHLSGDTQV